MLNTKYFKQHVSIIFVKYVIEMFILVDEKIFYVSNLGIESRMHKATN